MKVKEFVWGCAKRGYIRSYLVRYYAAGVMAESWQYSCLIVSQLLSFFHRFLLEFLSVFAHVMNIFPLESAGKAWSKTLVIRHVLGENHHCQIGFRSKRTPRRRRKKPI